MHFPLTLEGISLWLAFTAIILLITSEIISPYYGRTTILIDRRRLRTIALIVGILFLFTVFIEIYQIIIS